MTDTKKVLILRNVQSRVAGQVELDDGSTHDIRRINGLHAQELVATDSSQRVLRLYAIARECIPTANAEDINGLDTEAINAIVSVASRGIDEVEALFPNAIRPATVVDASTSLG